MVSFFPLVSGLAGEFFETKIGMFPPMKSNNVALQLSEKRIAKVARFKAKIHFLARFASPQRPDQKFERITASDCVLCI